MKYTQNLPAAPGFGRRHPAGSFIWGNTGFCLYGQSAGPQSLRGLHFSHHCHPHHPVCVYFNYQNDKTQIEWENLTAK